MLGSARDLDTDRPQLTARGVELVIDQDAEVVNQNDEPVADYDALTLMAKE